MPIKQVLIVDDHELLRMGLVDILNLHPEFNVIGEAIGEDESVEMAQQLKPNLVIMDVQLASGSGVGACLRIKKALPQTKVLILTSYAQNDILLAAIRAGASGYVLKQMQAKEMITAIEAVVRGDAAIESSLTKYLFRELQKQEDDQLVGDNLTTIDKQLLLGIVNGLTNREISEGLYLSQGTIRNYVSALLAKLGVSNRVEAATLAVKNNLVETDSGNRTMIPEYGQFTIEGL